jgi:hypothetical protein
VVAASRCARCESTTSASSMRRMEQGRCMSCVIECVCVLSLLRREGARAGKEERQRAPLRARAAPPAAVAKRGATANARVPSLPFPAFPNPDLRNNNSNHQHGPRVPLRRARPARQAGAVVSIFSLRLGSLLLSLLTHPRPQPDPPPSNPPYRRAASSPSAASPARPSSRAAWRPRRPSRPHTPTRRR